MGGVEQAFPPDNTLLNIKDIKVTQEFIRALRQASLDDELHSLELVENLCHPPEEVLDDYTDPDLHLSIEIFLAVGNASQKTYHAI